MNETIQMLLSPQFLVGTVIAGILVNIASNVIQSRWGIYWAKRSLVSRKKKASQIGAEIDQVNEYQEKPILFMAVMLKGVFYGLFFVMATILFTVVGVRLVFLAENMSYIAGVLCLILAMINLTVFASIAAVCIRDIQRFAEPAKFVRNAERQIAELEAHGQVKQP